MGHTLTHTHTHTHTHTTGNMHEGVTTATQGTKNLVMRVGALQWEHVAPPCLQTQRTR